MDVISKVEYSDWASSIAYVEKKNQKIRIYIFTNLSARAGYDTRSIFKRSLTGLNSEYSFF